MKEDPVIKKIRSSMGARLLRIVKQTCQKKKKKKRQDCLSRDSNAVLLLSYWKARILTHRQPRRLMNTRSGLSNSIYLKLLKLSRFLLTRDQS